MYNFICLLNISFIKFLFETSQNYFLLLYYFLQCGPGALAHFNRQHVSTKRTGERALS